MGVGAGLYMYVVVQKFTFAISSPDEFLLSKDEEHYTAAEHGWECIGHCFIVWVTYSHCVTFLDCGSSLSVDSDLMVNGCKSNLQPQVLHVTISTPHFPYLTEFLFYMCSRGITRVFIFNGGEPGLAGLPQFFSSFCLKENRSVGQMPFISTNKQCKSTE